MSDEMMLVLQILVFDLNMDVFDLLQQRLIFQEFLLLYTNLIFLHFGEIQLFDPFSDRFVDLLICESIQVR